MDLQTRLFGASFGQVFWSVKKNKDGKITYEGNDFIVLDNRNVFFDQSAQTIEDAKWVQVSRWVTLDEVDEMKENGASFKNLAELRRRVGDGDDVHSGDRRDNSYTSIIKRAHGVEDLVGADKVFPRYEMTIEYRNDKWIYFFPRYGIIIGEEDNPHDHGQIPIVKLTYYPTGDDMYGDIEIESVLPIQRAINALLCGFIDTMNIGMRPPVKVANNPTVRMDTLKYGPNAIWLVGDSVNNVQTHQTGGQQAIQNFQNSYAALKGALNVALGETSQGTSGIDPFSREKTATEIKSSDQQKITRDQKNQMQLEIAIKQQMMLWLSNNKQFLFSDPTKAYITQRVIGKDMIKDLELLELDGMEVPPEAYELIQDIVEAKEGQISDAELERMLSEVRVPKHPVIKNPNEKNALKVDTVAKLEIDEGGQFGTLTMSPEDFEGVYDYIPSIESLAVNESDMQIQGRQRALETMLNPAVAQMLAAEGKQVKISETLEQVLEDAGMKNASRLFEDVQPEAEEKKPSEPVTAPQKGLGVSLPGAGQQRPLV